MRARNQQIFITKKHLLSWFVLLLIAISLPAAGLAAKPNILLILSDDYGWGSAGCYGARGVKTPNMDRLAQEGRRFTQAYAPGSVCSPSRYALMTGRYYWRTPIKDGEVLTPESPLLIEAGRLTIASLCKSQGYRTALFGKWHLGMTATGVTDWTKPFESGPLKVGFDRYFGMAANIPNPPRGLIDNNTVVETFRSEQVAREGASADGTTAMRSDWKVDHVMETLTTKATGWIEANREQPFFLYFAPNAVHEPVAPNARHQGSPYGKYGDFITELDWSVGQILAALDRLKLAENTIVVFTSDNGGVIDPGNANSSRAMRAGLAINGPLRGGKHSEWEGGFREPFLVRWPGRIPAGTVSDQVICLTDLVATFASLLHVPLPRGSAEDSFDVLRAFTEATPGAPVRDHVILQSADATYDIRLGNWKLVERINAPAFSPDRSKRSMQAAEKKRAAGLTHDELFNLKEDPFETKEVSAANAARVAKLKQRLVESRDRGYTRPGAGN